MVVDAVFTAKLEGMGTGDFRQAAGQARRIVSCNDDAAGALAAEDVTQVVVRATIQTGDRQVALQNLVTDGRKARSKLGQIYPHSGGGTVVGEAAIA